MQLNKRVTKANRPEPLVKVIKIESFNPVMKPGLEITHFSTVNVKGNPSHCLVATARRAQ